jgi:hypothetical protein
VKRIQNSHFERDISKYGHSLYFQLSETNRTPSYGSQIEKVCSANKNVRDGMHGA